MLDFVLMSRRKTKTEEQMAHESEARDFAFRYSGYVLDVPFVQETMGIAYDAAVSVFRSQGFEPVTHDTLPDLKPTQLMLFPLENSPARPQACAGMPGIPSDLPAITRGIPVKNLQPGDLQNRIFEGDCLSILPFFPDSSIDLVLCDLPYGTTQNKWDSLIPLEPLWSQYRRILKPNGVVVLTSQGVFTAKLILSNEEWFKYKIVWEKSKPTNFLNAKKQPLRKHEDICVFYGRQPTYHPVMGAGVPYDKGVRKDQLSGSYGDFRPVHVRSSGERYPTDVVYFKTAESEGEVWHPTQKPVELGRYLVKTFTNPGDIVLDNAFGSGSFLVAAALEGRRYVGIEKNEDVSRFKIHAMDYVMLASARLRMSINGGTWP